VRQFIVVESTYNEDFLLKVAEASNAGYVPIGGPYITTWANGYGNIHKLGANLEQEPIYVTINLLMSRQAVEQDQTQDQPGDAK